MPAADKFPLAKGHYAFSKKRKGEQKMKNELTYVKAEIEIIEAGEDIIRTSSIDLPDIDLTEI